MEKSKRVVGYARVSTEAQDITRQVELITAYWKIQCKLPPKTKRFCPLVLK